MSAIIRAAQFPDIEGICELLHTKMNSRFPVEKWRRLMTYDWMDDKPDLGCIVEEHGRILGFVGRLYADRIISDDVHGDRTERICNLSSWYLDKSLRGRGLGRELMVQTVADRSYTYTGFTNSRKPLAIFESVGFRKLDKFRHNWRKSGNGDSVVQIEKLRPVIRERLGSTERKLIDDMADMPIEPMLLEVDGSCSLLFFSIKQKGANVTWYDLLYAGNPALFVRQAQNLANSLLPESPSVLAADSRLLRSEPVDSEREQLAVARYYMSERVAPHEIDFLYSELQLLDFKLE